MIQGVFKYDVADVMSFTDHGDALNPKSKGNNQHVTNL